MIGFLQRLLVDAPLTSNYVVSRSSIPVSPSYRGDEGDYVEEFLMEKDDACSLCRQPRSSILRVSPSSQLKELVGDEEAVSVWKGLDLLYAAVGSGDGSDL